MGVIFRSVRVGAGNLIRQSSEWAGLLEQLLAKPYHSEG